MVELHRKLTLAVCNRKCASLSLSLSLLTKFQCEVVEVGVKREMDSTGGLGKHMFGFIREIERERKR